MRYNLLTFTYLLILFLFLPGSTQDIELQDLIVKVSQNQEKFYLKLDNWKATVITTTTKMDKHWQPKEVTVVEKRVEVVNLKKTEEILKAVVTKKGIEVDVTDKYLRKAEKTRAKARQAELSNRLKRKREQGKKNTQLTAEDALPFSEKKRYKYNFSRLEDSLIDNRPVYVVEARAKIKRKKRYNGRYYISKDSFDILKIVAWPSKNPTFVKEAFMEMDFQVYSQGFYVMKKSKLSINAGIFIKRIRRVTEEEYFDYQVIDSNET